MFGGSGFERALWKGFLVTVARRMLQVRTDRRFLSWFLPGGFLGKRVFKRVPGRDYSISAQCCGGSLSAEERLRGCEALGAGTGRGREVEGSLSCPSSSNWSKPSGRPTCALTRANLEIQPGRRRRGFSESLGLGKGFTRSPFLFASFGFSPSYPQSQPLALLHLGWQGQVADAAVDRLSPGTGAQLGTHGAADPHGDTTTKGLLQAKTQATHSGMHLHIQSSTQALCTQGLR